MALPGKRTSISKGRRRRSHMALKPVTLSACKNCGAPRLPHRVCGACGYYNGRIIAKAAPTTAVAPAKKTVKSAPKKAPAKKA